MRHLSQPWLWLRLVEHKPLGCVSTGIQQLRGTGSSTGSFQNLPLQAVSERKLQKSECWATSHNIKRSYVPQRACIGKGRACTNTPRGENLGCFIEPLWCRMCVGRVGEWRGRKAGGGGVIGHMPDRRARANKCQDNSEEHGGARPVNITTLCRLLSVRACGLEINKPVGQSQTLTMNPHTCRNTITIKKTR